MFSFLSFLLYLSIFPVFTYEFSCFFSSSLVISLLPFHFPFSPSPNSRSHSLPFHLTPFSIFPFVYLSTLTSFPSFLSVIHPSVFPCSTSIMSICVYKCICLILLYLPSTPYIMHVCLFHVYTRCFCCTV